MLKKKCSLSFVVLLGMIMLLVFSAPAGGQEAFVVVQPEMEFTVFEVSK